MCPVCRVENVTKFKISGGISEFGADAAGAANSLVKDLDRAVAYVPQAFHVRPCGSIKHAKLELLHCSPLPRQD